MASPTFAAFLLITLLSISSAVHGRESHFFSKVASEAAVNPTTVNPTKDVQQQQPSFVQEIENNGYGLYGRQTPETTAYDQAAKLASAGAGKLVPNVDSAFPVPNVANKNNNNNNNGENGFFSKSYFNDDKYYGDESKDIPAAGTIFSEKSKSPVGAGFLNSDDKFDNNNNNRFADDEASNGVVEKQEYTSNLYNNDAENDAYKGNSFGADDSPNEAVSSLYTNNLPEEQPQEQTMKQKYGNRFSESQNGVASNFDDLYGNNNKEGQWNSFNDEFNNVVAKTPYGKSFSDNFKNGVVKSPYEKSFGDDSKNGVVKTPYGSNFAERQGMSDTRYMAGGKYYTEVNNPNQYQVNGMNDQYYGNSMNRDNNNNNQEQEAEDFQGNNYQNEQYDP